MSTFGARCSRFKQVMTAKGPVNRCASFINDSGASAAADSGASAAADWGDDFGDDFGFGMGRAELAGPLIGGGLAQVGTLAIRLLFKNSPGLQKWAPALGTVLGAGVSGAMMMSPRFKSVGLSGIVTAALVGVPRQVEDILMGSAMKDYLGVITAEQEMAGAYAGFGDEYAGYQMGDEYAGYQMGDEYAGLGAQQDVQLLDAGLGVITAEQEMNGPGDVELLGAAGFGSNFLAAQ
jgi:hypothetical protein